MAQFKYIYVFFSKQYRFSIFVGSIYKIDEDVCKRS